MHPLRSLPSVALLVLTGLIQPGRADRAPTPAESLAALRLADLALRIELVAADPDVQSPVAIAWDEQGRLYVAEMRDYPVAPASGRIKRLEDRDHDGRYEHVTIFADNLPYPSGVLPWNGGLLVTAAPDLLFLEDRDGDGQAEGRRVILTGFGEGNQQLRVNSPTWGLDNRVYLANGRSGGAIRRPGDPPANARAIPRSDLRLDPATGWFEPIAGFSQFGLPRDDRGDRFPSWNTVPIRHVVLEQAPGAGSGATVADILDLADGGRIHSLAPAQRRFNAETVAFFNASCGPIIERGGRLGPAYRGDAFVCEPLTSVVHHRKLVPSGPTYRAVRVETGQEFLASSHPWFRPVNLANGPDGALYVVDFCRAWVEHPAFVPESQRNSVDFREGFEHGRIWRITRRDDRAPPETRGLASTEPNALVTALEDPTGWVRDTAQRLLVTRKPPSAIAPLRRLATGQGAPLGRVHALWTLEGLGALDEQTLKKALEDVSGLVIEQAARLAQRDARAVTLRDALIARAVDPEPRVRLQTALALGQVSGPESLAALARIAARDADSPWMLEAITAPASFDASRFLAVLVGAGSDWLSRPSPAQSELLARLAARLGAAGKPGEIATLADLVDRHPSAPGTLALVDGLATSGTWRRWFGGQSIDPATVAQRDRFRPVLRVAATIAADPARPALDRIRALSLAIASRDPDAPRLVVEGLGAGQPPPLQQAAAQGVERLADPALATAVLDRWETLTIATRRLLIGALATSPALAHRLLDALDRGTVAPAELDPATRDALTRLNNPQFKARLDQRLKSLPIANRSEVVRAGEGALRLTGDAERGRGLFARHCQSCHVRGTAGAHVGPDLLSVAGKPPAELLVAILDPSREAAPDGQAVVVATAAGQTLTGLLVEESPRSIRLRRAEGVEDTIPRDQVEAIRPTGRSLMPDGLEQVLSPQDLADLIAFLRSNGPLAPPATSR